MSATESLASIRRKVQNAPMDPVKRRALLAALKHPDLVRARCTSSGVLLEGPGGIVSTHLSGRDPQAILRDLRRVGLA